MKNIEKERLDILLVKKGFFETREKAKRAIMAGEILVENHKTLKAGQSISVNSIITLSKKKTDFVSRGGDKLNKAILDLRIPVKGKRVIDVGASTGGFTDCLLKYGAEKIYCIDVGYGQLAWKLQKDSRIVVMDRTNVRDLAPDKIKQLFELATIDVSFISLEKVLPNVYNLLTPNGEVLALIKPQFEAGKEYVQKGGIIKKPEIHQMVIEKVSNMALSLNFGIFGLTHSPLKGKNSNIEYLIYLKKNSTGEKIQSFYRKIEKVIKFAHHELSLIN